MHYDIHTRGQIVNASAYMDFKRATDLLCEAVTHSELADALGVSLATVRQARLSMEANAHRSPPDGWQSVVVRLAERRAARLQRLADQIKNGI